MYLASVSRLCSGVALALCLPACSLYSSGPNPEAGMSVECELEAIHHCSKVSPEIKIANPPKGVSYYEVHLSEVALGQEPRPFGGGTWNHVLVEDGVETIPEGTLVRHYRGPCPPAGQTRTYLLEVVAMPSEGNVPLASASFPIKVEGRK